MGSGLFLRALLSLALIAVWTAAAIGALHILRVPRKHWEALIVLPPIVFGVALVAYFYLTGDAGPAEYAIVPMIMWVGAYLVSKALRLWR